jgi:uncharacterized protein (TIGR02996 family)
MTVPQPEEQALLQAIVESPGEEAPYLVLADWLEEHDDPRRAELLRLHRRLLATCCEPDQHPQRSDWQAQVVHLLAQRVKPCVPQRTIVLAEGVEMTFSFIPPGSFLMGSPESEERRSEDETLHQATLTEGFWLGISPVTQAPWLQATGHKPSRFKGDDLPVERVSWDDCQEFCTRLGEKTGSHFRLPTESQWEYSCRAGTTTPFFFGDRICPGQANYDGEYTYGKGQKGVSRKQPTPVGSFTPNAWGLFDLHGNVYEWCADWYGAYPAREVKDYKGPERGDDRVLRGGSWYGSPKMCRSAYRNWDVPSCRTVNFGCRVVLCLG